MSRMFQIPKHLVLLGKVHFVEYEDRQEEHIYHCDNHCLMCSNSNGKILYLLQGKGIKQQDYDSSRLPAESVNFINKWSQTENKLYYLKNKMNQKKSYDNKGIVTSIAYSTDRFTKKENYRHNFDHKKTKIYFYDDKKSKNKCIIITGGYMKVTSRGIIG